MPILYALVHASEQRHRDVIAGKIYYLYCVAECLSYLYAGPTVLNKQGETLLRAEFRAMMGDNK